jgi:hypothetical protein
MSRVSHTSLSSLHQHQLDQKGPIASHCDWDKRWRGSNADTTARRSMLDGRVFNFSPHDTVNTHPTGGISGKTAVCNLLR